MINGRNEVASSSKGVLRKDEKGISVLFELFAGKATHIDQQRDPIPMSDVRQRLEVQYFKQRVRD